MSEPDQIGFNSTRPWKEQISSHHPGIAIVGLLGGSTRRMNNKISDEVFRQLISPCDSDDPEYVPLKDDDIGW